MRALRLILHEAWHEFWYGIRSGVVTFTFAGMVGYLLMVLTSADNIQKLGATDVPRNSAILIYLMATGCMFFLFFAWAWVYAQPLLRDRRASLHEVVLSMPNSLATLLWGRFLGAVMVGGLLSGATLLGFILSPLLAWAHLVPSGLIASMPWHVLIFAFFWLTFPVGIGIGALYYLVTLKTRNIGGAFGLAALLVLFWMFAIIVLKGGYIRPDISTVLDPSLFTLAQSLSDVWTPAEKSTALLPLTLPVLLNRLLWCVFPVVLLAIGLHRIRRESLVLDGGNASKVRRVTKEVRQLQDKPASPSPIRTISWIEVFGFEIAWQLRSVFALRAMWIAASGLAVMGVLSAFVHVVWHAEGPMVPRTDMLLPLLEQLVYLVIAFLIAALAGYISRRDDVPGLGDTFDATPAPGYLRLLARAFTILSVTLAFALVPGVAAMIVTLLAAPGSLSLNLTFGYQLLVMAPPLMEIAIIVLFLHALIRRAGVAYAASMFVTFCLVVNHELQLISYPLYEVGIPGEVHLSALTGWSAWRGYLLALDGYKLSLCLLLIGLAAIVLPRGLDSRLGGGVQRWKARWIGLPGALALCSLLVLGPLGHLLRQKLVVEGDYKTSDESRRRDAAWEKTWLASAGEFSVQGGQLILHVHPDSHLVEGYWTLQQVQASNGFLDAELPDGFLLRKALVAGREVKVAAGNDHLRIPLGACAQTGCKVQLEWIDRPTGWSADGTPPWMLRSGLWLEAMNAAPRLGIDPSRLLRAPSMRARYGLNENFSLPDAGTAVAMDAVAPAGNWRWAIDIDSEGTAEKQTGSTHGPLSFGAVWATNAIETNVNGLRILSDKNRVQTAREIADDVQSMRACVARRLGTDVVVQEIAQWPRGLGQTQLSGGLLQLEEEPNWDIAGSGVGHWMRQARIAAALARRELLDAADLRDAQGVSWVRSGMAGAIGLLCVGDIDGISALDQVMARYADTTTRALAASTAPIGPLTLATGEQWPESYAPLSTLRWMNEQQPDSVAQLLRAIREQHSVSKALLSSAGEPITSELLGMPQSTSFTAKCDLGRLLIHGTRWRWEHGGWQAIPGPPQFRAFVQRSNRLEEVAVTECGCSIENHRLQGRIMETWPSYERSPAGTLFPDLCDQSSGSIRPR